MSTYLEDAKSDAQDTANNFIDEIHKSFFDNDGKASNDLTNDYSNDYHHENHVGKSYNLREAVDVLDDLADYEETDSGLWNSLEFKQAISAQAAYTYGNAVYYFFQKLIEEINKDDDIESLYEEYQLIDDTVQAESTRLCDVDVEVEKHQDSIKAKIKKRMEEIITEYT